MAREHTPKAWALGSAIRDAENLLRLEPTTENARAWLQARIAKARYVDNHNCDERVDRLEKLAADKAYCELIADLQRATSAVVDRRQKLIGNGTT